MFNFKSYYDLSRDIVKGISNIPPVDIVVGIPRSGIVPACMIASFLNIPFYDLDTFAFIHTKRSGVRKMNGGSTTSAEPTVLLVDDSVNTGAEMRRTRKRIESLNISCKAIYCAVYTNDIDDHGSEVDICLSSLPQPRVFQWNYRNHIIAENACFDMDGVLCEDPTIEQNDDGPKYIEFIENAKPLFIPQKKLSAIVTSRLERFRENTINWLNKHNIRYGELIMLDLPTAEERRRQKAHAPFKAKVYKSRSELVFIESNWKQAQEIAKLTDKPVICTENDCFLYGRDHLKTLQNSKQIFSYDLLNNQDALRIENDRMLNRIIELEDKISTSSMVGDKKGKNTPLVKTSWKKYCPTIEAVYKSTIPAKAKDNQLDRKEKMRVLLISISFDKKFGAGAAVSSKRLYKALLKQNIDVHTLSLQDFADFKVNTSNQPISRQIIAYWNSYYNEEHSTQLRNKVRNINPDVIAFGAIDRGIISLIDLAKLDYPMVWITRDNWSHTGGCLFQLGHKKVSLYDFKDKEHKEYLSVLGCGKFVNKCQDCSALHDTRENSTPALQYELKQLIYSYRKDIIFCPISKWLKNTLLSASLTKNHRIRQIYNPIDLEDFRPLTIKKAELKRKWRLPLNKKLVLVAAHSIENKRKGVAFLYQALLDSKIEKNIEFVMIGNVNVDHIPKKLRNRFHLLGYIDSDKDKVRIYNAVNATVVTALQESLSVVASDSLACGTPVISFATSGLEDFIEHKKNGYLAKSFDSNDLARGINWVCNKSNKKNISMNARKTAQRFFDEKKNTKQYIDLFKEAIRTKNDLGSVPEQIQFFERTFRWLHHDMNHRHNHIRYLNKRIKAIEKRSIGHVSATSKGAPTSNDTPKRIPGTNDNMTFKDANYLYRKGQYEKAYAIYQELNSQNPMNIYASNAAMTEAMINKSKKLEDISQ